MRLAWGLFFSTNTPRIQISRGNLKFACLEFRSLNEIYLCDDRNGSEKSGEELRMLRIVLNWVRKTPQILRNVAKFNPEVPNAFRENDKCHGTDCCD